MKVALLTDWYLPRLGGLELHIRDLAHGLLAKGCEVHVVTSNPAEPGRQAHGLPAIALPDPPGLVVHRLRVPLLPRYRFVYTRGAFRELEALFLRERYDVVHSMVGIVSPAAMGGAWVAQRLGMPLVVTFHSVLFGFGSVLRALDLACGWSGWPARFSAVSAVVAAEAAKLLRGVPVEVLPNGVDAGAWRVEHVPAPPGELRLASVMRLNARKRGSALLRAVANAQRSAGDGVRISLTLVGEGPEREKLERLAARLGISRHVGFAGYLPRERVKDVLARSDAFVLASRLESFGIAALEARAAGVPVVALERGGIKEFVRHDHDGLIAGSDGELAAHLAALASDPVRLARLRAGAAEQPVPFAWDASVEMHLATYRAALALAQSPGASARVEPTRAPTPSSA